MNDNELQERLTRLEQQVFGMTYEQRQEYGRMVDVPDKVIENFISELLQFDPKGSNFGMRLNYIIARHGLNDKQVLKCVERAKAVAQGRYSYETQFALRKVDFPRLKEFPFDVVIERLRENPEIREFKIMITDIWNNLPKSKRSNIKKILENQ